MNGETAVEVTNNTFVMPAGDVTITATFKESIVNYNLTWSVTPAEGGTVEIKAGETVLTTSPAQVAAGTHITITPSPAQGYEVESVKVNGTPLLTIDDDETGGEFGAPALKDFPGGISAGFGTYGFDMAEDAEVVVTFKKTEYTITVTEPQNGTVEPSATTANMGDEITLTITPATGYEIDEVTVMAGEDEVELDSDYKFTMPASDVTVTVTFKAITYELEGVAFTAERHWATYYNEPTPYGMVLIECGSMKEGPAQRDSLWGIDSTARGVSVDAFWMDENEVTNSKYKQFVYWVRDSIIRERLADPAYGGNEEFKIEEDKDGNPITPRLNWNRNIPWKNPSEDEERAIESVYRINPITGVKELDPKQMNYRYEVYNLTEAAKRRNRFDPTTRDYNTDHAVPTTNPTISKDTAFVDDDGRIIRQTITRTLQSEYDFVNTYIVNIFPDTTCWINDFENSYNEPYVRLYFANGNYNNHPVVGVSWEQANAFCHWRTEFLKKSLGKEGVYIEPFRLPTEAEWEFAARAGQNKNKYPWDGDLPLTVDEGCFYANFKPDEGNYVKDGYIISSPVGTYEPNDYGLYDMAGNVSEWTSTAYTESIDRMTDDINPEYRYYVAQEDPYKMSRKIVRGGSWKDVVHNLRSDLRMWEYQNEQRSYIGFRCVRSKVGIVKGKRKNCCKD